MSELTPPNKEIKKISDAFQIWTHFLSPRGLHNHHIGEAVHDTLTPSVSKSDKDEVAWIHTEHYTQIELVVGDEHETITSMRRRHGDMMLATGRDHEGIYSFTPLAEIIESQELPIYAASWLGRYVKTWSRDSFGTPRYPTEFLPLRDLPPFNSVLSPDEVKSLYPNPDGTSGENDKRSSSTLRGIALDERSERMARLALVEYPHLEPWYKSRGIKY